MILSYRGKTPKVRAGTFLAENATLLGDISIGQDCAVLFGAVLRADSNSILIGDRTNLQDNVVIHVGWESGVTVGSSVTVGHSAILHGCTVEDGCLIGMHATLLNGCLIGEGSLIAAGTLIKENQVIPPGSVVVGVPGRIVRQVSERDREYLRLAAEEYVAFGKGMGIGPDE